MRLTDLKQPVREYYKATSRSRPVIGISSLNPDNKFSSQTALKRSQSVSYIHHDASVNVLPTPSPEKTVCSSRCRTLT